MKASKFKTIAEGASSRTAHGYATGLEVNEAYAALNPHNCAVRERTADGVRAGVCTFYLKNGTDCPRHGRVKCLALEFVLDSEWTYRRTGETYRLLYWERDFVLIRKVRGPDGLVGQVVKISPAQFRECYYAEPKL